MAGTADLCDAWRDEIGDAYPPPESYAWWVTYAVLSGIDPNTVLAGEITAADCYPIIRGVLLAGCCCGDCDECEDAA